MRRLHLLSGREFHPLEAPGLSWRTVVQVDVGQERTNRLPLPRPPVTHEKLSLIDDSYLDPLRIRRSTLLSLTRFSIISMSCSLTIESK